MGAKKTKLERWFAGEKNTFLVHCRVGSPELKENGGKMDRSKARGMAKRGKSPVEDKKIVRGRGETTGISQARYETRGEKRKVTSKLLRKWSERGESWSEDQLGEKKVEKRVMRPQSGALGPDIPKPRILSQARGGGETGLSRKGEKKSKKESYKGRGGRNNQRIFPGTLGGFRRGKG